MVQGTSNGEYDLVRSLRLYDTSGDLPERARELWKLIGGDAIMRMSRTPDILADAAHAIFEKPAKSFTGNFLIDDTFLAGEGVTDFDRYRVDPSQPLAPDFFVPDTMPPPKNVSLAPLKA